MEDERMTEKYSLGEQCPLDKRTLSAFGFARLARSWVDATPLDTCFGDQSLRTR